MALLWLLLQLLLLSIITTADCVAGVVARLTEKRTSALVRAAGCSDVTGMTCIT